jgi:hypothetical protein
VKAEERRCRERTGIGGLRRIQHVEGGGEKMQGEDGNWRAEEDTACGGRRREERRGREGEVGRRREGGGCPTTATRATLWPKEDEGEHHSAGYS